MRAYLSRDRYGYDLRLHEPQWHTEDCCFLGDIAADDDEEILSEIPPRLAHKLLDFRLKVGQVVEVEITNPIAIKVGRAKSLRLVAEQEATKHGDHQTHFL